MINLNALRNLEVRLAETLDALRKSIAIAEESEEFHRRFYLDEKSYLELLDQYEIEEFELIRTCQHSHSGEPDTCVRLPAIQQSKIDLLNQTHYSCQENKEDDF